jgi:FkbM family methyltransferase
LIPLYVGIVLPFFSLQGAQPTYSLADNRGVPLDHKLVERMRFNNGVFIEVGAHDGIEQSNTKLLEEAYGWTGILIEPSNNLFTKLCGNRPQSKCFQCALGDFSQDNTWIVGDFDGDLMSSVGGNRLRRNPAQKVLVRSLQSNLDEMELRHINFFSLDTEGYELNILKGIDFTKTTFDCILVEIYLADLQEIISFLSSKGYLMTENFTNYNKASNPKWDGTHNDYLFMRQETH